MLKTYYVLESVSAEEGLFVNSGTFQKTTGTGISYVQMYFENLGRIEESSGKLKIENPIVRSASDHFGKHCYCGDPVDSATGNYFESQTDFAIGGRGVGLDLTRTYSAQAAATAASPGIFGYGWSNSFGDHLVVEGETATLVAANGNTVPFTKSGESSFKAPAWSQSTLSGNAEAGYTLTLPEQTNYTFSGAGKLESVTDRNGNKTTLAYTEAGKLKTIGDPVSRKITLTYNEAGLVESAEDPMGHLVEYSYEGEDLSSVTEAGEAEPRWQFEYDGSHRIKKVTNGLGGETTNEYDGSSRVISQTDPVENTLTLKYEPFHTTITNTSTGSVTDQWFTSNNEPFRITRGYGTPEATTSTFSYNAAGQIKRSTDGNGHTTTYTYDADGNLKTAKDPEGNTTTRTYNKTHDVISVMSPRSEITTIERDPNGNIESISRPGPEKTTQLISFDYDEHGQLESVTDPLERTWTFGYDGDGNRDTIADPLENTQTFGYDENSHLTSIVSPRGNAEGAEPAEYELVIKRDPQGRPEKVIDPLGNTTKYAYDANGNLEAVTDANLRTTTYRYNPGDEQIEVERPDNTTRKTEYDGDGEVVSQTDGNEETTTYVRDSLGQPVEVIDPLTRKTTAEYDDAGNLETLIDAEERETSYVYDEADRLLEIDYSEEATPDVEFEYDEDGNTTKMVDGTGESSFEYDELGRLTESEDGHADVVDYGYDLAEGLTELIYPNGKAVIRKFDGAGRLEKVTDWLEGTTEFSYDPDSNLEEIDYPSASDNTDLFEYDQTGRMSSAEFLNGEEALASLGYERNKIGQLEEEAVEGLPGLAEVSFGYDEDNRLTSAGAKTYEYDPADYLIKAPGTSNAYDVAGELKTGTGVAYKYDKLGQRVKTTPAGGPPTTYDYDQSGALIAIDRPKEGEVPAISQDLAYGGSGLLASQTSGEEATRYLSWDLSSSLPLLLDDGENSYIYGPGGRPFEQISKGEAPSYLHHDQLGSTRLLTDAEGSTGGTFTYEPYGAMEGSTETATTPMGFAGQYTDPETGLQYLRARFYDPATGQFLTRDPAESLTSEPYAYAAADPLNNVDLTGFEAIPIPLPACVAGPGAAAVCAGLGAGATCTAIAVCRESVGAAASDLWGDIFGGDTTDEGGPTLTKADREYEEKHNECKIEERGKEIGDARQSLDKAKQERDKFSHSAGSNPNDPRGGSKWLRLAALIAKLLDPNR
jgi:RHS repeat-associated protein